MSIAQEERIVHASPADDDRLVDDERIPGPAAGALLACGLGSAVFGAAVVAAESSEPVKTALTLSDGVGPLSGKALVGTLVFLVAWSQLHLLWRDRTVRTRPVLVVTAVLIGIGLLLTFPPVYQIWAVE